MTASLPVPLSAADAERLRQVAEWGLQRTSDWVNGAFRVSSRFLSAGNLEAIRDEVSRLFPAPVEAMPELRCPYSIIDANNYIVGGEGFMSAEGALLEAANPSQSGIPCRAVRLAVVEVLPQEPDVPWVRGGKENREFRVEGGVLRGRWNTNSNGESWRVDELTLSEAADPAIQALLALLRGALDDRDAK